MYTERFSECHEYLGGIYGAAVAANAVNDTGNLLMEDYHRAVIIIHPVDINDVLDIDVEEATTTAAGTRQAFDTGSKDISVAIADTAPSVIEVKSEEFTVNSGFKYLNVEATTANTGGNSNDFVVEVWGVCPRYKPTPTTNLDSVTD